MTDANDMIAHLEADPDSEIVAAMLTDELMESRGMLRTEADVHVLRLRRDARDALDIAFAARLIRGNGPALRALQAEVRHTCSIPAGISFTLYVTAGDAPPTTIMSPLPLGTVADALGFGIALPATWVRRWHQVMRLPFRARPKARRPRRGR